MREHLDRYRFGIGRRILIGLKIGFRRTTLVRKPEKTGGDVGFDTETDAAFDPLG
jgi:hypothetical protein